jgi:hypothetical protein
MEGVSNDDLVLYSNSDGKIYSGGFNINSIIFNKELSPIFNIKNNNLHTGGSDNKVSDLFDNLAIPRGLLYFKDKNHGGNKHISGDNEDNIINNDIYNKLLNLVEVKKQTHTLTKNKHKKHKGSKTKKHY